MTMKNIIRLLALVAILTAAALPASAQWGPEEEKNCFLNGKKGTITLSGQVNSAQGDSSKLEQYEEIPEGFLVPCAAYGWSNENYFFDAKAIDAALRRPVPRRDLRQEGRVPARPHLGPEPQLAVQHRALALHRDVRRASSRSRTPRASRCRTSTSPGSRRPRATPSASAAPRPTRPSPASTRSRTTSTRACPRSTCATCARPAGPASASRWARPSSSTPATPARSGTATRTRPSTAARATRSRRPIEYVTDNFRFGGEFAKGRFFLAASVDFSEFKNEVPYVEIDNPERLQMAEPDERPHDRQRRRLLPPLDAPGQRGLPGRLHRRHHAARAAQGHRVRCRPAT